MRLTIKRVGGQLPTLQPKCVVDGKDLDAEACKVARAFVRDTPRRQSAPHADAFVYIFELEEDGKTLTTSASFHDVPEVLRPMLPSPRKKPM
jgi:hypothetical protein